MLGNIGPTELIIILVIVLIIFGAGKLPDVGTAIGKGIRNFKKASKEDDDEKPKAAALEEGKDKGKG